jgi:putative hydrolase of HD superfamily
MLTGGDGTMITYALAAKLFEGFSILRWNDRLRPTELVEMEHHALKSILTYFLGKTIEYSKKPFNWRQIVDGNVFDLLSKITTSDIQAEVRKKLKGAIKDVFATMIIDDWGKPALGIKKNEVKKLGTYLTATAGIGPVQFPVLKYAHKYVTKCEFDIIDLFSLDKSDNSRIKKEISDELKKSIESAGNSSFSSLARDLIEAKDFDSDNSDIRKVFLIIERLRYQIRWSQTPRIPSTSVLGHCMYCAVLAYFISIEAGLKDHRIVNNFYAALFHDMPEALSRDIISPVKKADKKIKEEIEKIERELCEERIFTKIPEVWKDDFRFITGQMCFKGEDPLAINQLDVSTHSAEEQQAEFKEHREFSNRIKISGGRYKIIPWGFDDTADEPKPYAEPMYDYLKECGIDGKILKTCDNIAAYMEARMSIQHGIRSPHLNNGIVGIEKTCRRTHLYGLKVEDFLDSIPF